ncbi:Protein E6 [Bienertia sinuspersici]
MAYNANRIFFLVLTLCFSLQTHARDSKFFSKLAKQNHESISVSPTIAPSLAPSPSPEAEVIEHGYGLYGQDPFQSYEYPPTTKNPTKVSDEKYVSTEDLGSMNNYREIGNGIDKKKGMSDTRFMENGKYYYDPNQDVKDESSRQGMSDTRFLENGKYFHDINEEKSGQHFNTNNYENENENFGSVNKKENNGRFNTNNYEDENENEGFEDERHGMSDTRFLENGKYYYDMNEEASKEGKSGQFEFHNNGNENENSDMEKHGLSDTRFLDNGKYYYDVNNEKGNNNNNFGVEDVGFHNNKNVEYANSYGGNDNEYETEGRGGYNYDHNNEYHVKEGRGGYNGVKPKKFPNEYDTMEEYDREQGYIDGQEHYVP